MRIIFPSYNVEKYIRDNNRFESNRIENINNRFDFIKEKMIVSENEIIDFQILQNTDKLIVSNCSFSWWAVYLNHKNATIYAPNNWLGFYVNKEYPVAIIPKNFIKINFN